MEGPLGVEGEGGKRCKRPEERGKKSAAFRESMRRMR